jgi:spore germination cell wall hydrolase CwlJ-like protein
MPASFAAYRFRMVAYRPSRLRFRHLTFAAVAAMLGGLTGCGHISGSGSDRECLARAMYFESIRSSDDGMLAVGTVVMNRLESGKYGRTVCGVVGAPNQFAPGVLSKPMTEKRSRERAERIAGQVLSGKRHRGVGKAMFFHTAGRTYRFENMHYVLVEGGNAFYERRPTGRNYIPRTQIAQAGPRDSITSSNWSFGNGIAAVGHIVRPAAEPRRVTVASAQPVTRRPVIPAAEPADEAPASIEDLIIASNGW